MLTDTNSGNPTYYFRGNNYWGGIIKDGAIASLSTYYKNAMVLPVISLKANVIVADKGTAKDHYVVSWFIFKKIKVYG